MVRVGISVEGVTEERFIDKCLSAYLAPKGIFVTPVSMGGNISVDRVGHELNKLLLSFDVVTTLYDFYGFARKKKKETKASLEARILSAVPENRRNKVIPFLQMYEFEGLLFSSPMVIASVLEQEDMQQWATDILRHAAGDPERINDSPNTAPKKRFEAKYPTYREVIHSPVIACEIGIEGLREKCSGFNQWLTCLEALA